MKRIFSTIMPLIALAVINVSMALQAPSPATAPALAPGAKPAVSNAHVPPAMKLAGELWKLGYHEENPKYDIAEYVIENQTIDNWLQMFTYQKFKVAYPAGLLLVNFADQQIAELKKRKYDLVYTVHSSSADDAIIEFQIKSPVDQQQDEIQRLVKGDKEFYILHYVSKKMDMGDVERNKWIAILKGLNVKKFQS
jgi:hypothetical protein